MGFKRKGVTLFGFFVKNILKNPIGLVILGIILSFWGINLLHDDDPSVLIIGLVITLIGIAWIVIRKGHAKRVIAANLPQYLEIADDLKKGGYEVTEFEHKSDRVRSSVYLNGNHLGEIFLVVPGPRYAQFRRIEKMTRKDFEHEYSQKFKKHSGIPASYWPDKSLIGALIQESSANYSEKGKWLSDVAAIFKEKLSGK